MSLEIIISSLISTVVAVAVVYLVLTKLLKSKGVETTTNAVETEKKVDETILVSNAENEAKKIVLDAKTEALNIKQQAENEAKSIRDKNAETEKKLEKRLDELYSKIKEIEVKENSVEQMKNAWKKKLQEAEVARNQEIDKLEKIASMTKKEAQDLILKNVEKTLTVDIAKKIKESEEKLNLDIDKKTRELLVDAMQHASTDYVAEYTISIVKLPDEDIKGRIIGKEGRNIKAFEDATGVNVDFENSEEVRLSSFDAVRREIARLSMEKLIKDGRIHPARIEEIVKKTTEEMDKIILEAGENLCQSVGVYNLPQELVMKLGNFKYRTSYGQNMIQHTLEETKIGVKIAHEIGANIAVTKLACLLHDIGKVVTDKEGSHIELGADYLRKFKLPKEVISAVEEHHSDKPSSVEGVIVQIADSISGSRPGARYEDYEKYIQRMRDLENTAMEFKGVEKAFAISAGREVRVIVKPEELNDDASVKLSFDIAKKIEAEQTYPGTVKVVVVRELRSIATAS